MLIPLPAATCLAAAVIDVQAAGSSREIYTVNKATSGIANSDSRHLLKSPSRLCARTTMPAPFRSLLKGLAGNLVGRASSQVEPYVQFFTNVTSSLGDDFGCVDDLAVHCFASSRWVPGLSQVTPPQDVPILMQISLASDNAFGCPSSAVSARNDLETSFQVQRTSRSRLVVSRGLSFLAPQMGHVDVICSGCSCGGRVGGSVACF
mmetsp:Transcript_51265/g.120226  ORF Transcript_51265/g.120226 Transcript_51265/m.120226 type:complete len:206 (-) Transcript_51265:480-1097(-)